MKPSSIILVLSFSLAVFGCTNPVSFSSPPGQQSGLSCSIAIPKSSTPKNGQLEAKLVLTNTAQVPIRVCTLCMGWRSTATGLFHIQLDPANWKSAHPTLEQSAKEISTIQPGNSISIPFVILLTQDARLRVTAGYGVGEDFAHKLNVWSGYVTAEPVIVTQP